MPHKARWLLAGFVVAMLVGFSANPAPQPQRVSDLVTRIKTLETENQAQQDALDALTTRVEALEEALALSSEAPTNVPAPAQSFTIPEDWEQETTSDGILSYWFDPGWELTSDEPGTLNLWLDDETGIFFSWDWSEELMDDLREDEDFLRLFEEDFFKSGDDLQMEVVDSGSIEFLGEDALFWDLDVVGEEGYTSRMITVFYSCSDRESCNITLIRFDPSERTNEEIDERDWTFLQTFATGIEFLTLGKATTNANANVRSCPSTRCEIVRRLVRGEIVDLVAQSEDGLWYQLRSGEWIAASQVDDAPRNLPTIGDAEDIDGRPDKETQKHSSEI